MKVLSCELAKRAGSYGSDVHGQPSPLERRVSLEGSDGTRVWPLAPKGRAALEAHWRGVLDRHAASVLSLREFAARESLSANTLAYWKYTRLARPAERSTTLVPVHVIDDRASSD